MTTSFFVSDIHGDKGKYRALFAKMISEKPSFVFLGGDLLPHIRKSERLGSAPVPDFINGFLIPGFRSVQRQMGCNYPEIFMISGNDDHRIEEDRFRLGESMELWRYITGARFKFGPYVFFGYSFVPPTPFQLKDWEKFDTDTALPHGSIEPGGGFRTVEPDYDPTKDSIGMDMEALSAEPLPPKSVFLFHAPPFNSPFDVAVPILKNGEPSEKINIGSKAIKSFIATMQPYITMHGHAHESVAETGIWMMRTGSTISFCAVHNGPQLALVVFKLDEPERAERLLLDAIPD